MSTSLDFEDAQFVQQTPGTSDSEKLAKIVRAARLAGLNLNDATDGGVIPELVEWLGKKKTKSARDLHKLLSEFLDER